MHIKPGAGATNLLNNKPPPPKRNAHQVIRRRPDYRDRRNEYVEPEEIYIVATAHTSAASADAARRVIEEVRLMSQVLVGYVARCMGVGR